jgi:hypothetical protein
MRMLRAGLAGIIIAAATLATAKAQPYYPPYLGYGYPGYPAYWRSPPYYPWAPPAYPFPYTFFAPYSAGVGPNVDNDNRTPHF